MDDLSRNDAPATRAGAVGRQNQGPVYVGGGRTPRPDSLADVLERVLDKGVVIVGDIQVRLLDIELLTIKLRLMVASVERAREMGINWWEGDAFVTSLEDSNGEKDGDDRELEMQRRIEALEQELADARRQAGGEPEPRQGG